MLISVVIGLLVGAFGALLGVGGGVFLIPLLTGFPGVPIKSAIASAFWNCRKVKPQI
jgi:uncharacterized membrane protein YfcA